MQPYPWLLFLDSLGCSRIIEILPWFYCLIIVKKIYVYSKIDDFTNNKLPLHCFKIHKIWKLPHTTRCSFQSQFFQHRAKYGLFESYGWVFVTWSYTKKLENIFKNIRKGWFSENTDLQLNKNTKALANNTNVMETFDKMLKIIQTWNWNIYLSALIL